MTLIENVTDLEPVTSLLRDGVELIDCVLVKLLVRVGSFDKEPEREKLKDAESLLDRVLVGSLERLVEVVMVRLELPLGESVDDRLIDVDFVFEVSSDGDTVAEFSSDWLCDISLVAVLSVLEPVRLDDASCVKVDVRVLESATVSELEGENDGDFVEDSSSDLDLDDESSSDSDVEGESRCVRERSLDLVVVASSLIESVGDNETDADTEYVVVEESVVVRLAEASLVIVKERDAVSSSDEVFVIAGESETDGVSEDVSSIVLEKE